MPIISTARLAVELDVLSHLPPTERFTESLDLLDALEAIAVEVRQHRAEAIADLRAGDPPDTKGLTWDNLVALAAAGGRRRVHYQTIQQWADQRRRPA